MITSQSSKGLICSSPKPTFGFHPTNRTSWRANPISSNPKAPTRASPAHAWAAAAETWTTAQPRSRGVGNTQTSVRRRVHSEALPHPNSKIGAHPKPVRPQAHPKVRSSDAAGSQNTWRRRNRRRCWKHRLAGAAGSHGARPAWQGLATPRRTA
jgi:hypothetical protein